MVYINLWNPENVGLISALIISYRVSTGKPAVLTVG